MRLFGQKKHKIGLALGSGSARGLAHIGVLKALRENNINIDMIAGSSIGALVGAYYAKNKDIRGLEEITLNVNFKDLMKLADPNFFFLSKGFIQGKKVEELLKIIIGDIDFKDLSIPFLAVATDMETGKEIIIKSGSVIKAIRASISIPVIFTPIRYRSKFLIDGGVANPMPANILRQQGMDFIIASNVVKKPSRQVRTKKKNISNHKNINPALKNINNEIEKLTHENKEMFKNIKKLIHTSRQIKIADTHEISPDIPSIFETLMGVIAIMEYQIVTVKIKEADLEIRPDVNHIDLLEFYRAKEAITAGYNSAKEIILNSKLKKFK